MYKYYVRLNFFDSYFWFLNSLKNLKSHELFARLLGKIVLFNNWKIYPYYYGETVFIKQTA